MSGDLPPSVFTDGEFEGRIGFDHELRTHYEQEPDQIIIDNCAVLDYILDRERTSRDDALQTRYLERGSDVETLLEESESELVTMRNEHELRQRLGYIPESIDEATIHDRIDKVGSSTSKIDLEGIEPREGFRKFDEVDRHDKLLAEHAYQEDAVIATYDADFLHFPVNYTTPGMLI